MTSVHRTMILAGMDTTANSLARILQLLAENPDVQEQLRAEIVQAAETDGDGKACEKGFAGIPPRETRFYYHEI